MYRRTLDVRSGVGQLMHAQALGLRAAGARVRMMCRRGRLRYFARTGWFAQRVSDRGVAELDRDRSSFLIDHELEMPRADLVFAHGLIGEALRLQSRPDWAVLHEREQAFFRALDAAPPIVTCSELMKAALVEHYALDPERIRVHYPGCRADRFTPSRVPALRAAARRALGIDDAVPVIGFVTSGDFQNRGLDIFLAAAERVREAAPDSKFLVVGSKRFPDWAGSHPLVAAGHVFHRPKSGRPDLWMGALDLFLYPSRFDAYGIVVAEAQALGLPIVTSRRVGAAECLPPQYAPWLTDLPDSDQLAALALRLIDDAGVRRALGAAGAAHSADFSRARYVDDCVRTILAQNP